MARDFYSVLNVPRHVDAAGLRRAFRAAALRYHPDKNPGSGRAIAEAQFKEVLVAYQTLVDEDKRREYDLRQGPVVDEMECEGYDAFEDFAARNAFVRGMDSLGASVDVEILFESLFGGKRTDGWKPRGVWNGRAAWNGQAAWSGQTAWNPQNVWGKENGMGGGNFGEGEHVQMDEMTMEKAPDRIVDLPLTLEELFTGCKKQRKVSRRLRKRVVDAVKRGSGGVVGEKTLTVVVQPGYRPGDKIRFHEAGDAVPGMIPADILFKISQKPHPRFVRSGDNLRMKVLVSLSDALTGFSTTVEGIGGNKISVVHKDVLTPGTTTLIKGEGMPKRGKPGERGDLTLEFATFLPLRLTTEEKNKIREALAEPTARWERTFLPDRKDATCYVSRHTRPSSPRVSRRSSRRITEKVTSLPSFCSTKRVTSAQTGADEKKPKLRSSPSKRLLDLFR